MWKIFSVDRRSLGLYRIALGFFIALDTFHKFFLARDFYTDWGVMPRAYWIDHYMVPMKFSLHLASGDVWWQFLLMSAQMLLALAFLIGWRTRWTGGFLLALLCSLQSRNNLILSSSDELMRLMRLPRDVGRSRTSATTGGRDRHGTSPATASRTAAGFGYAQLDRATPPSPLSSSSAAQS
jgi:hypothetical protein